MARTLPTSIINAVNAQSTDTLVLALLTLTHSTFDTVRLVNNTEDVVSNGDTFEAFPFSVILPPDDEESLPFLEIQMPNVTRDLVAKARGCAGSTERIQGTLALIDYDDPDTLLLEFSGYEIPSTPYDADNFSFSLVVEGFLNEPFPGREFTPGNFPGVF